MRLLFLNQYFPPDPAPTGILLAELAQHLDSHGFQSTFLSAGESYRPSQAKGGRLKRELRALARMVWAGLRAPRADVVFSATSPPLLLFAATLVALWHRARSVHWLMDMYPELAVELGEIPRGLAARIFQALMGWCYRRASLVVALDDDMAARLRAYGVEAPVIRPWVFQTVLPHLQALRAQPPAPVAPWTWIYSGNLGRAHEWETLLEAQREIERRDPEVRLVFQGGGPARAAATARAEALGLRHCEWRGYVEEDAIADSLLACHACAVTQLPSARGLLWPSKLGLLLALPRPIVWVGDPAGAIAKTLRQLPHAGVFALGESLALANWLLHLKSQPSSAAPAEDPNRIRVQALANWQTLLRSLADQALK